MIDHLNAAAERRTLQVVAAVMTLIPLVTGLLAITKGTAALPGDNSRLDPTADSEYRFTNAVWFATAPAVWSTIPDLEHKTTELRIIGGGIVLGGLARVIAWRRAGRPHLVAIAGMALELLAVPALLLWQTRLANRSRPAY